MQERMCQRDPLLAMFVAVLRQWVTTLMERIGRIAGREAPEILMQILDPSRRTNVPA
jgi:hypothetical protein